MSFIHFEKNQHQIRVLDQTSGLYFPMESQDGILGYQENWFPFVLLEQKAKLTKSMRNVLRKHPEWLETTCPPLSGQATLLEAIFHGKPKKQEDAVIRDILFKVDSNLLQSMKALELALITGRFITAEDLWQRGVRFHQPPSSKLVAQAFLFPFRRWDTVFSNSEKTKGPLFTDTQFTKDKSTVKLMSDLQIEFIDRSEPLALVLMERWMERLNAAKADLLSPITVQVVKDNQQTDTEVPLAFLAGLTYRECRFLSNSTWNTLWTDTLQQAGQDWGYPIKHWNDNEDVAQPLMDILATLIDKSSLIKIEQWNLNTSLKDEKKAFGRPRM